MLITELYNGQGLGNQLWSYVVTRALALDRGLDFGIMSPEKFKGESFLELDFGKKVEGGSGPEGGPPETLPAGIMNYYAEKEVWHPKFDCDIRDFDPGLLAVPDNTKLEGYFQSEKFILHRRKDVREWLKVKPAFDCRDFSGDNICVMNVRGGEYKWNPDLLLRKKYWTAAVKNMLRVNPGLGFVVITDDVRYAEKMLPEYPVFHFSVGKDYAIIKNAKYLILSNSSFAFFPAWTSETVKYVIAPKYWARHNVSDGFWACAFNLYRDWMWQDRNGDLFTFGQCEAEYAGYAARAGVDKFPGRPPAKPLSLFGRAVRKARWVASAARNRLAGY